MYRFDDEERALGAGAQRVARWVERAMGGGIVDWSRIAHEVMSRDLWPLVGWASRQLEELPFYAVLYPSDDAEGLARRALERFIAELLNREGNPTPLIRVLRREFLHHGGPAFDLLLRLCAAGRPLEAAVLLQRARLAGSDAAVELEAVERNMPRTPPGVVALVEWLVAEPSEQLWRGVSRHLPADDLGLFVECLLDLGAEAGPLLYAAAAVESPRGLGRIVDTGIFPADLLVPLARDSRSPGLWLALAARAALAQGYDVRCVELLQRALASDTPRSELLEQLEILWRRADADLRLAMAGAGVPVPSAEEASGELSW